MQRIHPAPTGEIEPDEAYRADRRPVGDRPWVLMNMIASADGGTRWGATSGGLGGDADRRVFRALREAADAVLVGAGTVRAERYGPPPSDPATRARRADHGSAPVGTIVIVTASLDLDLDAPLFHDATTRPVVVTHAGADPERRARVEGHAEVVVVEGDEGVDLAAALRALRRRGVSTLLCEGGPTLNGQMVARGLVDEVCLTVSPKILAGSSPRIVVGQSLDQPQQLTLDHVLMEDSFLFLRYVVDRAADSPRPSPGAAQHHS